MKKISPKDMKLCSVSGKGEYEKVKSLLDDGADPNAVALSFCTPLFWCCMRTGNLEVAKLLIERGADVDFVVKSEGSKDFGMSCLMKACERGFGEIVALFLFSAVDARVKNKENKKAFDLCGGKKKEEMQKMIQDYIKDPRLFYQKCHRQFAFVKKSEEVFMENQREKFVKLAEEMRKKRQLTKKKREKKMRQRDNIIEQEELLEKSLKWINKFFPLLKAGIDVDTRKAFADELSKIQNVNTRYNLLKSTSVECGITNIASEMFYCVMKKKYDIPEIGYLFKQLGKDKWRHVLDVSFRNKEPFLFDLPSYITEKRRYHKSVIKKSLQKFGIEEEALKEVEKKLKTEDPSMKPIMNFFRSLSTKISRFDKKTDGMWNVMKAIDEVSTEFVFLRLVDSKLFEKEGEEFSVYLVGEKPIREEGRRSGINWYDNDQKFDKWDTLKSELTEFRYILYLLHFRGTYYQLFREKKKFLSDKKSAFKLCRCFEAYLYEAIDEFGDRKKELFGTFTFTTSDFDSNFYLSFADEFYNRREICYLGIRVAKMLDYSNKKELKDLEYKLKTRKVILKKRLDKDIFYVGESDKDINFTGMAMILMNDNNVMYNIYKGEFENGISKEKDGSLNLSRFSKKKEKEIRDHVFDLSHIKLNEIKKNEDEIEEKARKWEKTGEKLLRILNVLEKHLPRMKKECRAHRDKFLRRFRGITKFGGKDDLLYIGEVLNDKPSGYGAIFQKRSGLFSRLRSYFKIYEGEFENGVKEGKGKELNKESNIVYLGNFKMGLRDGEGRLFENSEMKRGIFRKGDLIERKKVTKFKIINYETIDDQIANRNFLGGGANGKVYKVILESHERAVKLIDFRNLEPCQFRKGSATFGRACYQCSLLDHPSIIRIYGFVKSQNSRQQGIIMDKHECDMTNHFMKKQLPIPKIINYLSDVAVGMKYLHSKKVLNRDLKWENCLLTAKDRVVITDFDTFREDETSWKLTTNMTSKVGTPFYLAPELITKENYTNSRDPYDELKLCPKKGCRKKLQRNNSRFEIPRHVATCGLRPQLDSEKLERVTGYYWLIDLMKACWRQNPEMRLSFEEISHLLLSKKTKEKEDLITIKVTGSKTSESIVLLKLTYDELVNKIGSMYLGAIVDSIELHINEKEFKMVTRENFRVTVQEKMEMDGILNFLVNLKNPEIVSKKKLTTEEELKDALLDAEKENERLKKKIVRLKRKNKERIRMILLQNKEDERKKIRIVNDLKTHQVNRIQKRDVNELERKRVGDYKFKFKN